MLHTESTKSRAYMAAKDISGTIRYLQSRFDAKVMGFKLYTDTIERIFNELLEMHVWIKSEIDDYHYFMDKLSDKEKALMQDEIKGWENDQQARMDEVRAMLKIAIQTHSLFDVKAILEAEGSESDEEPAETRL